jgi:ribosomal protein L16 Arg81 hydroxylase
LADNAADFSRALDAAAAETDVSLAERRIKVAAQETWSTRTAQLMEEFQTLPRSADERALAPAANPVASANAGGPGALAVRSLT